MNDPTWRTPAARALEVIAIILGVVGVVVEITGVRFIASPTIWVVTGVLLLVLSLNLFLEESGLRGR